MDTKINYRQPLYACIRSILLFTLFIGTYTVTWAETNQMFSANASADAAKASADKVQISNIDRLMKQPAIERFEAANLHAGFIQNMRINDSISVNIFGENITMLIKSRKNSGTDSSIYAVNSDTGAHMTLSIQGNNLAGTVQDGNNLYSLQSLGGTLVAIIQVDQSQLREHGEDYPDGSMESSVGKKLNSKNNRSDNLSELLADSGDVIRVMVAYTSAASAAVTNINTTIALAISETNQSYLNSGVTTTVELAHSYQTTYTETGNMSTDLSRVRTANDGYMDEAQALRNTHAADVVVLMGSNSYGYCGLASTILASESTAYAMVAVGCATGYYSFGHEIGHLQGARHIITNDPSTTPFAYGHGYCQPGVASGWRTVMAYGCPNGDGTRIPYWSNPNVNYGGVAMGIVGESNNARVLNETAFTVANFRSSASTTWTIGYDWNCDGSYNKSDFVLNDDGTFTTGSYTGSWWENHNTIAMTFSSGTKYIGRHQGNSMTGKMATTGTSKGCWYGHPDNGFVFDNLSDPANQTDIAEPLGVNGL